MDDRVPRNMRVWRAELYRLRLFERVSIGGERARLKLTGDMFHA